ncbi:MAG: type II secretion system protein GspL [Phycisphaerales bacterium]
MQSGNQLGIYLRKDRATVVCLASQGRERKLLDCFSVRVEANESDPKVLYGRIAGACDERKTRFAEAAVALDCGAVMQHTVHSEFSDARKVAATVRFDTEETLATDVTDLAVSFRIASSDEEGAGLDVFTVPRADLTDVIQSLQSTGIDPVAIDPDVCCLSRYLAEYAETQEDAESSTLYAALSDCRGYLVVLSGERTPLTYRTFLIGASQDKTSLLAREAMVTTALVATHPVGRLRVCSVGGDLPRESIGERTGFSVEPCDLAAMAGVEPGDISDCSSAVDFALAYGAALGLTDKVNSVNLRNDHMPFLGKKMRQQKAVRFLSVSVTILLLAVGVFFHSQLLRENRHRADLRAKFEPDYLAVMPGKTKLPETMKIAVDDLKGALRTLKAEKTGIGADQDSVSAKLTLVLSALNACAEKTGLNVKSVTISSTIITVDGTTSGHHNAANVLMPAMEKGGVQVLSHRIDPEDDHDKFSLTLEPRKQTQGR